MKTKMLFLLSTLFLFFASAVYAGQRGEDGNGTWWKTLDRDAKLKYLTGLLDGEYLGALYALPGKSVAKDCAEAVKARYFERSGVFENATAGEIANKLDVFFKGLGERSRHGRFRCLLPVTASGQRRHRDAFETAFCSSQVVV